MIVSILYTLKLKDDIGHRTEHIYNILFHLCHSGNRASLSEPWSVLGARESQNSEDGVGDEIIRAAADKKGSND